MLKKTSREGFTLVELSLSMVFIGILSVSVVLIINNTMSAYRRGLALSQINTVGIGLVDDMRAAVQNSSTRTLRGGCALFYSGDQKEDCSGDEAYHLVSLEYTKVLTINGATVKNVPIYGVFCTGTYSYIWNSGYFESSDVSFTDKDEKKWAKLKYKAVEDDGSGNLVTVEKEISGSAEDANKPFRLLKVEDGSRAVCAASRLSSNNPYYIKENNAMNVNVIDISKIGGEVRSEPEEVLIADHSNNLAIYDLSVARPVESPSGNNAFYSVSFILGTINGGINVMAKGNACATPSGYETENFDYCAINKFNFAVQVNGGI